jgi:hypothetical protein
MEFKTAIIATPTSAKTAAHSNVDNSPFMITSNQKITGGKD